ncbi:hypothetical protein JCM10908_003734 [Rhodotorula pacifica]|uniref:uncharacterized protein n=1 Tax=Rhodotorula pacifica TaxID=1495444 RepID=UPI00317E2EEE
MGRPRVRILGLPGYATSAQQLRGRLAKHLELWGDDFELIALDPVEPLFPSTISTHHLRADETDSTSRAVSAYRWWEWDSQYKFKPGELERALAYLRRFLETQEPFDVICGFSQGSAMAVLLLALLERPNLHPIWSRPSSIPNIVWPPQPVRCAVLCSGFGPGDSACVRWFEEARPTVPTLHIIGRNDPVVDFKHSLSTAARFENAEIRWHDGGHHIPRKPYWGALMREFMLRRCDINGPPLHLSFAELSSPTESAASSAGEVGGFFPLTKLPTTPSIIDEDAWAEEQ